MLPLPGQPVPASGLSSGCRTAAWPARRPHVLLDYLSATLAPARRAGRGAHEEESEVCAPPCSPEL